jgi:hypothetical protein
MTSSRSAEEVVVSQAGPQEKGDANLFLEGRAMSGRPIPPVCRLRSPRATSRRIDVL